MKSTWNTTGVGVAPPAAASRRRIALSAEAREELERRRQINEDSPRNPPRWIPAWRVRHWLRGRS